MKNDIEITFNTKRKIFMIFLKVCFISIGIFFLIKANDFEPFWVIRSAWVLRLAGFIAIAYFGTLFILYLKVAARKVALIIDKEGIVDRSSFVGVGRILWSQISGIKTHESNSASYVLVFVNEPAEIIKNSRNWFERWHLRVQNRSFRTPVAIPMIALNIYIDDLESLLLNRLEDYKNVAGA